MGPIVPLTFASHASIFTIYTFLYNKTHSKYTGDVVFFKK